jgi:hypothetical protein
MTTTAQPHAPRGPLVKRDHMAAPDLMAPRKCSARAKSSGQPCQRPAIHGGTVCRFHGGAAPQVKLAAMERLRALQNPAIDRLAKLIAQEEFPTVAYAASRDVLDRTLGKPQEQVQLTGADEGPVVFKWQR